MRVLWTSPLWKKPEEAVGGKSLSLSPLLLMLIGRCHVSPNPQGNTYCLLKWNICPQGYKREVEFGTPNSLLVIWGCHVPGWDGVWGRIRKNNHWVFFFPYPRDASLILEAVKRNEFLRCLGDGQSQTLVESFTSEQRQPGDIVVAEGDDGHAMYIVAGEGAMWQVWGGGEGIFAY